MSDAVSQPPVQLDYELLRMVGRGSYGTVWLVRDRAGQYCACKVVYREQFDDLHPYEREYAGIRRFEPVSRGDPGQLKILHVGRHDEAGYFYYLMELGDDATTGVDIHPEGYVPKTLKTELRQRGRLPTVECVQIGLSLCAALANLHGNGLIHRDIKPSNIIFVNGTPKLADIGLITDADVTVSYVGTTGYIAPEGPTSAQADLYSLGKVLYELSTGMDRLEFPALPLALAQFPDREEFLEFNTVVTRACEAELRRRYATAQEMAADLALLKQGKSIRHARRAKRRWTWALRIAGAAALLVTVVTAALWLGTARPAPNVRPAQTNPRADLIVRSAQFGTGGKVVDVTARVVELLRTHPGGFTLDAKTLGADPLPGKRKLLTLRYDYQGTNWVLILPSASRVSRQALAGSARK
jgi:Protein kinase domain